MVGVGLDTSQTEFNEIGKTGGEKTHKLTVNEIPKHNHIGLYDQANQERQQSYGTGDAHTGKINGMGVTTWNGQFHVGFTGGDQAHNNLQPYKVVAYWKRVA